MQASATAIANSTGRLATSGRVAATVTRRPVVSNRLIGPNAAAPDSTAASCASAPRPSALVTARPAMPTGAESAMVGRHRIVQQLHGVGDGVHLGELVIGQVQT